MNEIPQHFIFMKVGNHAGESFEQIIERKRQEIEIAGRSFWGYGGNTLHPTKHAQPFARMHIKEQGNIYLFMEPMDSKADPAILQAKQFSVDGQKWESIPDGIKVTGSRYALVLDEILPEDLTFPVDDYSVGIGPSQGRVASEYIKGRVDKGCFTRRSKPITMPTESRNTRHIGFVANLTEPFSVFLK